MENTKGFKVVLGRLRIPIIKAGIKILDKWLIGKIPFEPLKTMLQKNLGLIERVTDVMTDKDPNNTQQLKEVWEANKEQSLEALEATAKDTINQLVKNPLNALILTELLEEILAEQRDEEAALAAMAQPVPLEHTTN